MKSHNFYLSLSLCLFLVSYNCSFDGGLCALWDQDTTDDVEWIRCQGSTPTSKTGPRRDHTTGKRSVI